MENKLGQATTQVMQGCALKALCHIALLSVALVLYYICRQPIKRRRLGAYEADASGEPCDEGVLEPQPIRRLRPGFGYMSDHRIPVPSASAMMGPTTNNKQQTIITIMTTINKQQTTNNKQQTTNNPDCRSPS